MFFFITAYAVIMSGSGAVQQDDQARGIRLALAAYLSTELPKEFKGTKRIVLKAAAQGYWYDTEYRGKDTMAYGRDTRVKKEDAPPVARAAAEYEELAKALGGKVAKENEIPACRPLSDKEARCQWGPTDVAVVIVGEPRRQGDRASILYTVSSVVERTAVAVGGKTPTMSYVPLGSQHLAMLVRDAKGVWRVEGESGVW